ncbi:MAG TPA: BTAD domain-containing putative transcriptional regulator [Acidimicrobiales bacterium]|nr:BTAD domain-containing putative transcriptional regulator [Acidimicrobiales bacterium]
MIAVRLLGPVEVEVDGDKVALSRTLERALLARLALEPGQPVSTSRLVDDLWGDHAPRDGVASLQGLVYRLRRTLGPEGRCIVRVANGYSLDAEAVQVDVTAFHRLVARARATSASDSPRDAPGLLRAALDLWRGPPLSGLESLPFVGTQATRLNAARLAALGDRIAADLAAGRHGDVIAELETLVAEHPFEERFWGQLMLALYRSGSQAGALRCFARLRGVLRDELGIDPGPAVAELEQSILRQDPCLALAPAAPASLPAATGAAVPAPDDEPIDGRRRAAPSGAEFSDLSWLAPAGAVGFVGRLAELDVARSARLRAVAGEQLLLLVTGEPGIGKTRLTAEFAREFDADGDLVLHGRWDEEPLCPYQAFREALGRYARRAPASLVRADVGPLTPVLGRIVPELVENHGAGGLLVDGGPEGESDGQGESKGEREGEREGEGEGEGEGERYQAFDAVSRWIDAIAARRRLVLVLDDLHWADRPSLLLLEYLLRSTSPSPVLIVATYRQTDAKVAGWFSESLAGIRRTASVERVALGGLSAAETQELVEAAIGRSLTDPEAVGAANLQRHTGGNPFFLQEVVRDLNEAGRSLEAWTVANADELLLPDRLRDVVHWRLRQLSGVCMRVLSAASAMGEEFDIATVGQAIDCDEATLLAALDEARQAGVVSESSRDFDTHRFAHAVVRQALYDELGLSRRARLHRQLGAALEARYGVDSGRHAAELARHFYLGAGAGGVNDALRYLRLAADYALQQVAYEAAADHLARALEIVSVYRPSDELERCHLLLAIGRACMKAGRTSDANARFLEAFDVADRCGRADLLAEAALGYGGVLPAGSEPNPQARALLESALPALSPEDGRARALVLGRLAQWGHFDRPRAEREALVDEAVAIARHLDQPSTLAAVLGYRYWALDGPDDPEQQVAVAMEIRRLGEQTGDRETVLHGLKCELHSRFELGDFERSRRVAADLGAIAAQMQQPEYLRLGCMWDSLVAGIEGRYADAEQSAAQAAAILERTEHPQLYALYVGLSLPWRWLQGRMEELRPLLELGKTGRASLGESALVAWVASEIGHGDQAGATLASLDPAEVTDSDHNFHWWFLVVALAQTAWNLGDRQWAAVVSDIIEPYADHNCRGGQATFLGAASMHLGALSLLLGRNVAAVAHLEAALARHQSMRARPFACLTQGLLATALRRDGSAHSVARARQLEDEAGTTAAALGIAPRFSPPGS